jgi:hypothetical protein
VDDATAYAALHHKGCRVPEWNDEGLVIFGHGSSQPTLTHLTRLFMLPLQGGGQTAELLPMMIVNPAMESVFLERDPRERWRPQPGKIFAAAGLASPGPGLHLRAPINGARGHFTDEAVTITMLNPPHDVYECGLTTEHGTFRRLITEQGGIMLGVTQAVNPDADNLPAQFHRALREGRVLRGWVTLSR